MLKSIRLLSFLIIICTSNIVIGQTPEWNSPLEIGYTCTGVSIDSKENFYYTGYNMVNNRHDYRFMNDTLYIPEYKSGAGQYWYYYSFIAKTNSKKDVKWIKGMKGTASEYPSVRITCSEIDGDDNIIIAGKYSSSIYIDTTLFELGDGESRLFVAKLDSCGSLVWFNSIEEESGWQHGINDVKVDDENNVYVGGYGSGSHAFYDQYNHVDTLISSSYRRIFFAKYSSLGDFEWCEFPIEGSNQSELRGMDVDGNGDIYITGWWAQGGTFNKIEKISSSSDIFIAKYDVNKEFKWLKQFGTNRNSILEVGNDIVLDKKLKCIYVTGAFVNDIDIDGCQLVAKDENIFLVRISTVGNVEWVKKMGSWSGAASYTEQGTNVYVSEDGFVYVGGTIGSNGNFDGVSISAYDDKSNSNLYFDFFIAKYSAMGQLFWVTHAGHPNFDDDINDILKLDNRVYVVGQSNGLAIFDQFYLGDYNAYNLGFVDNMIDNSESILELSESNLTLSCDSNLTHSFDIICNESWDLDYSDTWIYPSVIEGVANNHLTLQVDTNYNSVDREAIITITSGSGIEKQLKIKQLKNNNDVAIEDVFTSSIKIYPNPAKEFIVVKSGLNYIDLSTVYIYNVYGQLLYHSNELADSKIDISFLIPGIYILSLEGNNFKVIRKIFKTS